MVKLLLLLLLSISWLNAPLAQIIKYTACDLVIAEPSFNSGYIKNQKIKSIKINLSTKTDNEVIIDKGLTKCFEFDTSGKISKIYFTEVKNILRKDVIPAPVPGSTKQKKGKLKTLSPEGQSRYSYDTVVTDFYYNDLQQLNIKRTLEKDIYYSWYYEYDDKGNIKKEQKIRETNEGSSTTDFKLGMQTLISLESFEYLVLSDKQIKKKCLNDEDRIYKEGIINYDDKKRKIDENYEFIVSWVRIGNSYKYDDSGRLIEKTYSSNATKDLKEIHVYEYDSKGNILLERKIINDIKTNETSYLYDENKTLLKSHLNRDFVNGTIGIAKYSYSFYK